MGNRFIRCSGKTQELIEMAEKIGYDFAFDIEDLKHSQEIHEQLLAEKGKQCRINWVSNLGYYLWYKNKKNEYWDNCIYCKYFRNCENTKLGIKCKVAELKDIITTKDFWKLRVLMREGKLDEVVEKIKEQNNGNSNNSSC